MESKNGSPVEVLLVFLRLGCTSFGGPVAHLGYFRKELVERRRWCTEPALAELIGLAQSLPGPASSQVGFALGLLRAGWLGGLIAWAGFTLPSAVLMVDPPTL
jgi:chromate transporter